MKVIGLCCDHAGFTLKEFVKKVLTERGWEFKDFGTNSTESCDYPDFAHPLAKAVEEGEVYPVRIMMRMYWLCRDVLSLKKKH